MSEENMEGEFQFTPMQVGAASVREFFETLAGAGFTDMQALYLTGVWVGVLTKPAP